MKIKYTSTYKAWIVIIVVVVLGATTGLVSTLFKGNSLENTVTGESTGDANSVSSAKKKELTMTYIEGSSQSLVNHITIGGFVIMTIIIVFSMYH